MKNLALINRIELEVENYVRKADAKTDYWFDLAKSKIEDLISEYGDEFRIIIAGSDEKEGDFYVIPYKEIKHLLKDIYLSLGEKNRWIGSVNKHIFTIRSCPDKVDVSKYYGDTDLIKELTRRIQ